MQGLMALPGLILLLAVIQDVVLGFLNFVIQLVPGDFLISKTVLLLLGEGLEEEIAKPLFEIIVV